MVGKKNLKELKGKNFIVSCNHMSNMDPIMMDIKFRKKFRMLAKIELFSNKFAGFFMKQYGAIPVDRNHADTNAIKQSLKVLNDGKCMTIFPQGHREKSPRVEDGTAKEGVAMLSIRTNTPVVPMMFSRKIKMFRRVKLLIGAPIYPDPEKKRDKEYLAEFSNLIIEKMNQLLEGENK